MSVRRSLSVLALTGAMAFLARTDALIIDLRTTRGGSQLVERTTPSGTYSQRLVQFENGRLVYSRNRTRPNRPSSVFPRVP